MLPLMYLHGMSSGDFAPALSGFFGSAAGLSASVVTRLTTQWEDEHKQFSKRPLADVDYVYCWADGVHFNVRLDEERLCCLVIVGVRADGTKEFVAIASARTTTRAGRITDFSREQLSKTSTTAQRRWRKGLDTKDFAEQIRAMGFTPD